MIFCNDRVSLLLLLVAVADILSLGLSELCPSRSCDDRIYKAAVFDEVCKCDGDEQAGMKEDGENLFCFPDTVDEVKNDGVCRTKCCDSCNTPCVGNSNFEYDENTRSCACTGDICEGDGRSSYLPGDKQGVNGKKDCRNYCCTHCRDTIDVDDFYDVDFPEGDFDDVDVPEGDDDLYRQRRISESEADYNELGIQTNVIDITAALAAVKESSDTTPSPCTSICYCYGRNLNSSAIGFPTTFEECSDECDGKCLIEDIEECKVAPLFTMKGAQIDDKWAIALLSEWQESAIFGSICACEKSGYMVGRHKINDFLEEDCQNFCARTEPEPFGGVRSFQTTETDPPSPTSSPTSQTSSQDSGNPLPWWAITIIILGFGVLAYTICYKRTSTGSDQDGSVS